MQDEHLPKDGAGMALFKGDRAIRIAVEALKLLIQQDKIDEKQKGAQNTGADKTGEDGSPAKRSRAK